MHMHRHTMILRVQTCIAVHVGAVSSGRECRRNGGMGEIISEHTQYCQRIPSGKRYQSLEGLFYSKYCLISPHSQSSPQTPPLSTVLVMKTHQAPSFSPIQPRPYSDISSYFSELASHDVAINPLYTSPIPLYLIIHIHTLHLL